MTQGVSISYKATKAGLGYRFLKRTFDIAFSSVVIVILAIPTAALSIAIAIDSPGAPFFRQSRIGKDGKEIKIFKLRTMYKDANEHPEKYFNKKQLQTWEREQKVDADPRITRIGKGLRATSLDEFPQFINVLIGDMSVVGPRPVTEQETYEFGTNRQEALSVRPGITGLWQVTARNDATWASGKRQQLELQYVRTRSIGLDLQIMGKTIGAMNKKTGQ